LTFKHNKSKFFTLFFNYFDYSKKIYFFNFYLLIVAAEYNLYIGNGKY